MTALKFSTSINAFNRLFSQLANQANTICWIRSLDYSKQLYLSPQFENIFGGSCDSLYRNPNSWWDYLLPNDFKKVKASISSRIMSPLDHDGNSIILFRVNAMSSIRYLRDTSFVIYNDYKKPIAIAGIGEELQPELWHKIISDNTPASVSTCYPDRMNVIDILMQENHTLFGAVVEQKLELMTELKINGIHARLTKRESEVLLRLRQGKTAKETGEEIYLSQRTVETHLESIKNKTGCKTKLELMSKIVEAEMSA